MAKIVKYECDYRYCSHTRTPTNHWFLVREGTQILQSTGWKRSIIILPFTVSDVQEEDKMFCGETHLTQYISSVAEELFPPAPEESEEIPPFTPLSA